jgi:oligo-alginate lyase
MYFQKLTRLFLLVNTLATALLVEAQQHPNLIMTKKGVEKIRMNLGKVPLFDETVKRVKEEVDADIALGIHTPIPKDFSGGYTHQRHKQNFIIAQKAGALYQILQDEKYAKYIRDMLFQYEAMYKDLPVHPQERSYARGKLFWQSLNDSNWLVYMSQAYDAIYETLSVQERQQLDNNLFRPFADFISIKNPQFYNRIHNHSTWGNAAVGMIALVMNDEELLHRALYGIEDDGLELGARDNDGGLIKVAGQKAGFLANLDDPFSPDGYYTEGPYYQRYAMYPFLIFALGMHNAKPEMKVFEHKDNVLLKAVNALLNLSDADGKFFPLNDGQKGMSYYTSSLVTAVDIAYQYGDKNPQLLSIAEKQNEVLLDESGLAVAIGIRDGKAEPFVKKSINLSDGPNGKQGGVGILRYDDEALTLVFKYSAQGSSHGHYDKLSYSLYNKGHEVLQDYGLARFVNIGQKGGGNYLKENKTWAKQTIAHNTLTQNQTSHFGGEYETGSQYHSDLHFFDASNEDVQVVSAKDTHAYPGTKMHRTLAMIKLNDLENAFVLDIMKVSSESKNQYDFPFYFMGQVMNMNFDYDSPSSLSPLGEDNGYEHLYVEGKGKPSAATTQFSWLGDGTFYTLTTATNLSDELLLTRLGAKDPEFNLRRDAAFMIRRKETGDTVFASIIEPHGGYNTVSELSANSSSSIAELKVVHDDAYYTAVSIIDVQGHSNLFIVVNQNPAADKQHHLQINGKSYRWKGAYYWVGS